MQVTSAKPKLRKVERITKEFILFYAYFCLSGGSMRVWRNEKGGPRPSPGSEFSLQTVGGFWKSGTFRWEKYRFSTLKVPLFSSKSTAFLFKIRKRADFQAITKSGEKIAKFYYIFRASIEKK